MPANDRVSASPERWLSVAQHVVERRTIDLRLTQRELERRDLSVSNIGKIEAGRAVSYRGATIRALEDALGWERGSVQSIIDGGDPRVSGFDITAVQVVHPDVVASYARRPGWTPERQAAFEDLMREAADRIFGEPGQSQPPPAEDDER